MPEVEASPQFVRNTSRTSGKQPQFRPAARSRARSGRAAAQVVPRSWSDTPRPPRFAIPRLPILAGTVCLGGYFRRAFRSRTRRSSSVSLPCGSPGDHARNIHARISFCDVGVTRYRDYPASLLRATENDTQDDERCSAQRVPGEYFYRRPMPCIAAAVPESACPPLRRQIQGQIADVAQAFPVHKDCQKFVRCLIAYLFNRGDQLIEGEVAHTIDVSRAERQRA